MQIKRIKKLQVNSYRFDITWDKKHNGASFSYPNRNITIGLFNNLEEELFMLLCHELMEIVSVEMGVRFNRPDCDSDYLFSYDHRQHETLMNMFAGLLSQFIK